MNVAIIGYGKMGREIERRLIAKGDTVSLIIDREGVEAITPESTAGIDVAIEFSTPESAFDNIIALLKCGMPVVCGTTAWLDRLPEAKELCSQLGGALFYASNYSIGVNIMFKVNQMLARLMNSFTEYDVTLLEEHHTQKKDAPSGTAITLLEGIIDSVERKDSWVLGATTEPNELGVAALRRSVVPGTHKVVWESEVDIIEFTHTAKSRAGFAEGAIAAARFIVGKKGFYTMEDIFK